MELEILDVEQAFFPPASSDAIDHLAAQYQQELKAIELVASLACGDEFKAGMRYYIDGNQNDGAGSYYTADFAAKMFNEKAATIALTEAYWRKAIALTNVYDFMPQKRRDEWEKSLTSWRKSHDKESAMPEFEAVTVRSSLQSLLAMCPQFLAEKVDGVFRNLSTEHLTNQPEGFSKRIIMWYSYNSWGISADSTKSGYLGDLRSVISKFMGNEEISWYSTRELIDSLIRAGRFGQWVSLDGNSLRIKIFKKGTAHLEVHPSLAYRLNMILAQMHPMAIPSEFRNKPDRKLVKDFGLMEKPLSDSVMRAINKIVDEENRNDYDGREFPIRSEYDRISRFAVDEALAVLERLGGVIDAGKVSFDYNIRALVKSEINFTRCVPETKTHQYYPTPEPLAQRLLEMANIRSTDMVLEPSAGTGSLLSALEQEHKKNVTCVEVAALHCEVLKKKGFSNVFCEDFLEFAKTTEDRWDCIIMNPPFSDGRYLAHVNAAVSLLKEGGRLLAILPSTAQGKLKGDQVEYSEVIANAFPGVGVSVIIAQIAKEAVGDLSVFAMGNISKENSIQSNQRTNI